MKLSRPTPLQELAAHGSARIKGDPSVMVEGLSDVEGAQPGDLVFAVNELYLQVAVSSEASVIVLPPRLEKTPSLGQRTVVVVDNPHAFFDKLVRERCLQSTAEFLTGVHATAVVAPTAHIAADCVVEAYCVVGEGSEVGSGTRLLPHSVIGDRVRVGTKCTLGPHAYLHDGAILGNCVTVGPGSVIATAPHYLLQHAEGWDIGTAVGTAELQDRVYIGAGCTVDRGILGTTVVGENSTLDSHVHVGHDVQIGRRVRIAAQTGIAGYTRIGDDVVLRGQVGIAQRIRVGDRAVLGKSGVSQNVAAGSVVFGVPAVTRERFTNRRRALVRRIRRLESEARSDQADAERRVFRAIASEAGIPPEEIKTTDDLRADLGFDSLDRVALQSALEDEFETTMMRLRLDDAALERVRTVGDVIKLVKETAYVA